MHAIWRNPTGGSRAVLFQRLDSRERALRSPRRFRGSGTRSRMPISATLSRRLPLDTMIGEGGLKPASASASRLHACF